MAAPNSFLITPSSICSNKTLNLNPTEASMSNTRFLSSQTFSGSTSSKFLKNSSLPLPSFQSLQLHSPYGRAKSNSIVSQSKNFESAPNSQNSSKNAEKKMFSGFSLIKHKNGIENEFNLPLASVSTSTSSPPPSPPTSTYLGTPLMWVGLGVALTLTFSMVVKNVQARLQKFMMQKMFEQMNKGGGMGAPNPFGSPSASNPFGSPAGPNPFGSPAGSGGNPFAQGMPFPPPPSQSSFSSPPPFPSPSATISPPPPSSFKSAESSPSSPSPSPEKEVKASPSKPKKSAFVDVDVDEIKQKEFSSPWNSSSSTSDSDSRTYAEFKQAEVMNDSSPYSGYNNTNNGTTSKPRMSMDALEKLLADPTIQKMIYPYLPEEMRDPTTFKWMLQNPMYKKQLEDMLNNMEGGQWDPRLVDMMKDYNNQDMQEQFASLGMKPEDVVAKIMANPEIAMAFQNPRLQAAIMDISSNPMNVSKYYNDAEVMDIFSKLSALFPAAGGMPPKF